MGYQRTIEVNTNGKGLYDLTPAAQAAVKAANIREGFCLLYIPHTSASLLINENYDPTVKQDLVEFLARLAPEGEAWYRHTIEGEDDSPAHQLAALLPVNLTIPVENGRLALGQWQGIFLVEHRQAQHRRTVDLRVFAG